ncbi:MAG: GspE/PulE family protein [Burkholderiales bacterium]
MNASLTSPRAPRAPFRGRLNWRTILNWLGTDGVIALEDAIRTAKRFGAGDSSQHPLIRLAGAGLLRLSDGVTMDLEVLTEWLAQKAGFPYLHIDPLKVDVGRVAEVMSINYAEKHLALPIQVGAREVVVATCEPFDLNWVAEIESHTQKKLRIVVVSPLDLARYTTEFYNLANSVKSAVKAGEVAAFSSFEQLVELGRSNRQLEANDQGVVQVVDWLWQYAYQQRASDIHLEPRRDLSAIRFRIDGVMQTVYQLPSGVLNAMIARVKLLGRMDVVEKRRPQDGRIKTRDPKGVEIEMRLATIPTAFGEKMVMRIFDPETTVKPLQALGFGRHVGRRWESLIAKPHGIILVTGPTGSGKTTTLYSTLRSLATEEVNVCTVEDPIEMIQPAFNQTQVQSTLDFSFAEGVRALMRQDPDIIMVGEIRDLETAEMAVQSALTGHLVFSTLHTNDAISAIARLTDLGVPPYLISATLEGILAQRLVRTLCLHCKQPDPDFNVEMITEMIKPWRFKGKSRAHRAVGCLECRMTGYRGRAGLYELLTMSEEAKAAIHPVMDKPRFQEQVIKDGWRPLRMAGAMKILEGVTTIEEVMKVTSSWSASQPSLLAPDEGLES